MKAAAAKLNLGKKKAKKVAKLAKKAAKKNTKKALKLWGKAKKGWKLKFKKTKKAAKAKAKKIGKKLGIWGKKIKGVFKVYRICNDAIYDMHQEHATLSAACKAKACRSNSAQGRLHLVRVNACSLATSGS